MFERLPLGLPMSKAIETEEKRIFIEVRNKVRWVNDRINVPFKLVEGETSRLGVFAGNNFKAEDLTKGLTLRVHAGHHRSALVGRVIFNDEDENIWRDIDIKGTGLIMGVKVVINFRVFVKIVFKQVQEKVKDPSQGLGVYPCERMLNITVTRQRNFYHKVSEHSELLV